MERDKGSPLEASRILRLRRKIQEGFFLRFHMSLILLGVFFAGLIISKGLLEIGLTNLTLRYLMVILFSYLVFLFFIRLWLLYIKRASALPSSDAGFFDPPSLISTGAGSSSPAEDFAGPQGGAFAGGGASGDFADAPSISGQGGVALAGPSEGSSGVSGFGDLDLNEGGLVLIILGLLLAFIFGVGIYLIYAAPTILSEAALQLLLTASFVKASKKLERTNWMKSIFKATWIPLLIILSLTLTMALIAAHYFPGITKLSDVLRN
jgi:hypothetical protein